MRMPARIAALGFLVVTAVLAVPAHALPPMVDSVFTQPGRPCHLDNVWLTIDGTYPGDCWVMETSDLEPLRFTLRRRADIPCGRVVTPWKICRESRRARRWPPSGRVRYDDRRRLHQPGDHLSRLVRVLRRSGLRAGAGPADRVAVDRGLPCGTEGRPPCAGDSLGVCVRWELPDDCWDYSGLEILPQSLGQPGPVPPIVRLTMMDRTCELAPCDTTDIPFQLGAVLPPLPPGNYSNLVVETGGPRLSLGQRFHAALRPAVPFTVGDCDSTRGTASSRRSCTRTESATRA